jgi:hypothetical protein
VRARRALDLEGAGVSLALAHALFYPNRPTSAET